MRQPSFVCVCVCVPPYELMNQLGNFFEIQ
jgi:hypothetical protein